MDADFKIYISLKSAFIRVVVLKDSSSRIIECYLIVSYILLIPTCYLPQ